MAEALIREENLLLRKITFHPPIDNADPHHTYTDLLDRAMQDRDVTNIALAGPYGAGKSSILKTYFDNRRKSTYHPVWISMAGFENTDGTLFEAPSAPKDESTSSDQELNAGNNAQRRIEQSILQQLFYSVEKKDLPLSQLRRIEKPDMDSAVWKSVWILTYLYFTIVSFKPSLLPFAMPPEPLIGLFQFFFLLMTFVTFPWIIGHLSGARLNKIIIKDTEFSFVDDEQLNTSLINRHVDEIINYFEATGKDVLVIEDLDRFKMRSIFTKLRELNTLINQYAPFKEKNKKVVFIYAVKDDLFAGEERTKFFDAIIPVIPQVNASGGAMDFFKTRLGADITDKLGVQFLTDISIYIHDFRLLTNICNEFIVYIAEKEGNEQKIRQENYVPILGDSTYVRKLFALIVYKNFFPEDFARLHQNRGWVYKRLNEKVKTIIDKETIAIETSIANIEANILTLKEISVRSLEEARLLGIVQHLENLGHKNIAAINDMTPAQMAKSEQSTNSFLHTNGSITALIVNGNRSHINIQPAHQDIFARINKTAERLNGKITEEQNNIADKAKLIRVMKRMSLVDLIKEFGEADLFTDTEELYVDSTDPAKKLNDNEKIRREPFEELVKHLLRQGYIANDYGDFISYFSGDGIMSHSDRDYRQRVNNNKTPLPDAHIDNPEAIYVSVDPQFFSHPAAVNHQMCRFLFTPGQSQSGIEEARKHFMDAMQNNYEFMITFLESPSDISLFIKYFVEHYQDLAWTIIADYNILDLRKRYIALNLLANLDYKQIEMLGENFIQFLETEIKLLSMQDEFIESIDFSTLKSLNMRFSNMGNMLGDQSRKLLKYIYKEDLYQLTVPMISELTLLATEPPYKREYWDVDYSKIINLGMNELISRVDREIEKYVNDIFIPTMETYGNPFEKSIIMLLNHEDLSDDTKVTLTVKFNDFITNLADLKMENQREMIMKYHLAKATWENILTYYEDVKSIDTNINYYLKEPDLFNQLLSSEQYPSNNFDPLIIDIALSPDVSKKQLAKLAKVVQIPSISLENIEKSKIQDLVESGIIMFNPDNYQTVIENSSDLMEAIGAEMIIQNFEMMMENIHQYPITKNQAAKILDGLENLDYKMKFASSEACLTVDSSELASALGRMAMEVIDKKLNYQFEQNQLFAILASDKNSRDTKLRLAVDQLPHHNNEIVLTAIKGISSHYIDIAESEEQTEIHFSYSDIEEKLLKFLSERKIIGKTISKKKDELIIKTYKNPKGKTVDKE